MFMGLSHAARRVGFGWNDIDALRAKNDRLLSEIEADGGLVIRGVYGVHELRKGPARFPGEVCMMRSKDGFTMYGQIAVDLTVEQAGQLMEWLIGQFGFELMRDVVPNAETQQRMRELVARAVAAKDHLGDANK